MNPEIPNVSMTGRYSIGRTCAELGIHRNTLRQIPETRLPKHHHMNGRTFYLGKDIRKYWFKNMAN